MNLKRLSPSEQVAYIKKKLGYSILLRPKHTCLNTGIKKLNGVFGSRKLGIVYGKEIIIAGPYSSGKTLIATKLAAKAQKDGAIVGWGDIENSFDPTFVRKLGLDPDKVALFEPEVGIFGRTKKQRSIDERLQTAEELFTIMEDWLVLQRKIQGKNCKVCLVVDSITNIMPEEEIVASYTNQNMRTRVSLAVFLNYLTKRWVTIAKNTNAVPILISQLRQSPNAMFRNPEYIPGGKGLEYNASVIALVRRIGAIKNNGRLMSLMSTIKNIKNKAGDGSVEGLSCGFRIDMEDKKWQFMSVDEIKKMAKRKKWKKSKSSSTL